MTSSAPSPARSDTQSRPRIKVIIPFYQRDEGILARALVTIAAQDLRDANVEIVVVDDNSPVGPEREIELAALSSANVTVIRQENAGPAAARNTGLEYAEKTASTHVAFLDSDDEWSPAHLSTALACLAQGSSFYFCDNVRAGADGPNQMVGFDHNWPERRETQGITPISGVADAYHMSADVGFEAFFARYLAQTSTVVFDLVHHVGTRFDSTLRGAGEDHLLWLHMARTSSGVSFCTKANVTCGLGVNIYFSAIDWSMPQTRDRFGYLALLNEKILGSFQLNDEQRQVVAARRRRAQSVYGYLLIRNLMKGRMPTQPLFNIIVQSSPLKAARLALLGVRLGLRSSSGRTAYAQMVT
jgi:succinoglycan biosynthesis protein ExoW